MILISGMARCFAVDVVMIGRRGVILHLQDALVVAPAQFQWSGGNL
jgi:hypothetical protein